MNRATSCRLEIKEAGERAIGSVASSDAIFFFSDGLNSRSKCDQNTFDWCDQRGVACLTTGLLHFRR